MNTPFDRLMANMTNADKPSGPTGYGWEPGQQLEALRFYLKPEVEILAKHKDDMGEGMMYAVLKNGTDHLLWADDYGDGPDNDVLAGACKHRGYEYIMNTFSLRVRWFLRIEDVHEFLQHPDEEAARWSEDWFIGLLQDLRSKHVPITTARPLDGDAETRTVLPRQP